MRLRKTLQTALIMILIRVFSVSSLTCHLTEYQIGVECCPLCPAGNRVKTHCYKFINTSCLTCSNGTFMDRPNGKRICNPCSTCDAGFGLQTNKTCEPTSDTVCEPMDGFFCVEWTDSGCSAAQKHKSCKPGQYISSTGTSSSDAECSACSSGTFSDGSSTSCQPHRQCQTLNLRLIQAGNSSADAECGGKWSNVTETVLGVLYLVVICIICIVCWKCPRIQSLLKQVVCRKKTQKQPEERTNGAENVRLSEVKDGSG